MKACSEIMRDEEEVVGALGSIPVGPIGGDEVDGAAHHSGGLEGHGEAVGGEVAGLVDGGVEPVGFVGVGGADGAGQEEAVHEDLGGEHVCEAARVFVHELLVVFVWEFVYVYFQPSHWIILKDIPSTSCSWNRGAN